MSFNNDGNPKNRGQGEYLLGVFYRKSLLSKPPYYPTTSFKNMLAFYDEKYPGFVSWLGNQVAFLDLSKLNQAMEEVGAKGAFSENYSRTAYPRPSDFSLVISDYGIPSGFGQAIGAVKDGLVESAVEIGNFSLTTLKVVLVVGLIAGGFYLHYRTGGKMPKWLSPSL